MGQQQLLLIILGLIVIGLAVMIGIVLFRDNAASANRDAITNDLVHIASRAQQFFWRPLILGGGEGRFDNLTDLRVLTSMPGGVNENGTYSLQPGTGRGPISITGTGVETGNDGSHPVRVVMQIWADSAKVDPARTN